MAQDHDVEDFRPRVYRRVIGRQTEFNEPCASKAVNPGVSSRKGESAPRRFASSQVVPPARHAHAVPVRSRPRILWAPEIGQPGCVAGQMGGGWKMEEF